MKCWITIKEEKNRPKPFAQLQNRPRSQGPVHTSIMTSSASLSIGPGPNASNYTLLSALFLPPSSPTAQTQSRHVLSGSFFSPNDPAAPPFSFRELLLSFTSAQNVLPSFVLFTYLTCAGQLICCFPPLLPSFLLCLSVEHEEAPYYYFSSSSSYHQFTRTIPFHFSLLFHHHHHHNGH